jgi:hypothetical protein
MIYYCKDRIHYVAFSQAQSPRYNRTQVLFQYDMEQKIIIDLRCSLIWSVIKKGLGRQLYVPGRQTSLYVFLLRSFVLLHGKNVFIIRDRKSFPWEATNMILSNKRPGLSSVAHPFLYRLPSRACLS